MLLISILFCDTGPGFLIRAVCKYSMVLLIKGIMFSYIHTHPVFQGFSSETPLFTSRELYVCLETFLYFLHQFLIDFVSLGFVHHPVKKSSE